MSGWTARQLESRNRDGQSGLDGWPVFHLRQTVHMSDEDTISLIGVTRTGVR